jgi:Domain of unknown function (DUF6984)
LRNKDRAFRLLRAEEIELLRAILEKHSAANTLLSAIERVRVRDLSDGGMGSIELGESSSDARRMLACVAEADYVDSDGVSVSIAINVDQNGHLFELDMWKVDFSPLIQYPILGQLETLDVSHLKIAVAAKAPTRSLRI